MVGPGVRHSWPSTATMSGLYLTSTAKGASRRSWNAIFGPGQPSAGVCKAIVFGWAADTWPLQYWPPYLYHSAMLVSLSRAAPDTGSHGEESTKAAAAVLTLPSGTHQFCPGGSSVTLMHTKSHFSWGVTPCLGRLPGPSNPSPVFGRQRRSPQEGHPCAPFWPNAIAL